MKLNNNNKKSDQLPKKKTKTKTEHVYTIRYKQELEEN